MAADPNAYKNWHLSLPIPWLAAGPNGQAEASTWPSLLDYYVSQLVQARYQALPDYAAVDSLSHLANDRQFITGPNEPTASITARLKDAWGEWSRAGTALGVLEQLAYFGQSNSAIWVQQNGLSATLGSMPTPGQDPTSLLTTTATSTLSTALTSAVVTARSVPAGNSWFAFDLNTDLTNRFAIIYTSWPFAANATAYFSGTDSAAVTWPFSFPSTSYSIQLGPPVINDSSGPVRLVIDGSTQTTTGVTVRASAPFYGYASVTAYAAGVSPLNFLTSAGIGQMQKLISTFRPSALCMGVYWVQSGRMWDWPANTTWDGYGGNWDSGPSAVAQIIGAF